MSLSSSLMKSSAFLFAIRLMIRSIGLLSTIILARWLTPEDYGVVAVATLAVYFFDSISNAGTDAYIMQKKEITDSDLNTAWSLNILMKGGVWILYLVSIPFIANYYDRPELKGVLFAISFILPLSALENVGTHMFRRNLTYKPIFILSFYEKFLSFCLVLILAWLTRNYWAMVAGIISGYLIRTVGSYIVHPFRPRLNFSEWKVQWNFSKWIVPQGVLGYLKSEFDSIVTSWHFSMSTLGGFTLMKSLTGMIGRDVMQPATEPLLAAFAKNKEDKESMRFQMQISIWIILIVISPFVLFVHDFAKPVILVLYGSQWTDYSVVLSALSFLVLTFSLSSIFQRFLTALERVNILFYFEIFNFAIVAAVLLLYPFENITEFAYIRSLLAVFFAFCLGSFAWRASGFAIIRVLLISALTGIALASASLAASALAIPAVEVYPIIHLAYAGCVFFSVYALVLFALLYILRGQPEVIYLKWLYNEATNPIYRKLGLKKPATVLPNVEVNESKPE